MMEQGSEPEDAFTWMLSGFLAKARHQPVHFPNLHCTRQSDEFVFSGPNHHPSPHGPAPAEIWIRPVGRHIYTSARDISAAMSGERGQRAVTVPDVSQAPELKWGWRRHEHSMTESTALIMQSTPRGHGTSSNTADGGEHSRAGWYMPRWPIRFRRNLSVSRALESRLLIVANAILWRFAPSPIAVFAAEAFQNGSHSGRRRRCFHSRNG